MKGLYEAKPWFVRRLRSVEDVLVERRVSPDSLTIGALFVSIVAGCLLALGGILEEPRLWLFVPPLGVARLTLNALDGCVARRTGRSGRPFGLVLNEVVDRLSDVALLCALAFVVGAPLALAAVAATLVTSTTGLLGSLVTGERLSGGPMGKADRVVVVAIGAWVAGSVGSHGPLLLATWIVTAGTVVTFLLRIHALHGGGGRDV